VLSLLIFQEQQQAEGGALDEAAEPFMGSGRFGIVSAPYIPLFSFSYFAYSKFNILPIAKLFTEFVVTAPNFTCNLHIDTPVFP